MVLLFSCVIGLLYQQYSIAALQTRIGNYQTFILLHAYKQDKFPFKCPKCRYKNMIPLYSDTSIFKYSKQINAMYPTLFPNKK